MSLQCEMETKASRQSVAKHWAFRPSKPNAKFSADRREAARSPWQHNVRLWLKFLRRSLQRIICPSAACSLPPRSARCKWHFYVFCITMQADFGRRASWKWTTTTNMRLMQRWYAFNSNKRAPIKPRVVCGWLLAAHFRAAPHQTLSMSNKLSGKHHTPPRACIVINYVLAMIFALCYW